VKTSTQLKAKSRNLADKTGVPVMVIQRNYLLERFLERVSLSDYHNAIILKGGILITSLLGIGERATLDLDATLRMNTLTEQKMREIINGVLSAPIDDGVSFALAEIEETRVESNYPGFRVTIEASIDKLRDHIKLDFTAGDIVTPRPIEYGYKLLFEEREIEILAYNIETILAEKYTAILMLSVANTRMKDFYDIAVLTKEKSNDIDKAVFAEAVRNTSKQRQAYELLKTASHIIDNIASSPEIAEVWKRYVARNDYAKSVTFRDAIAAIRGLQEWSSIEKPSLLDALQRHKDAIKESAKDAPPRKSHDDIDL
jgi:predicted nucleotidyltransferase component of viral defense system